MLVEQNNKYSLTSFKNYIPKERIHHLHEASFTDILNVILNFLRDSIKLYQEKLTYKYDVRPYIARVCNSIMGAGKTTALIVAGKIVLKRDNVALLLVFNNLDTMKVFYEAFNNKEKRDILEIHEENYYIMQEKISQKKIVMITQQRLYQIQLGYGSFFPFKYYKKSIQRTIIADEMLNYIDGEIFDIGEIDNYLDWFDTMSKSSNLPINHIKKARVIINSLVTYELCEYDDNAVNSLPIQCLLRHEKDKEKIALLKEVLNEFKKIDVNYKTKNRYKWFMRLLENNKAWVLNRDNKTFLFSSSWVDYTNLGNILILDGTSDIIKTVYDFGGYEYIHVNNYHDYQNRLYIDFRLYDTSKTSRLRPETHQDIKADLQKLWEKYNIGKEDILVLPAKADIIKYRKTGIITDKQHERFFKGRTDNDINESMALNILNLTGNNALANYNYMVLLTLPIRNPIYYKQYAIALYGVETNTALNSRGRGNWFKNPQVQELYEKLFLRDLSQIIHRSKIRRMKDNGEVYIIIYSNRKEWMNKILDLYGLPTNNLNTHNLMFNGEEYANKCDRILSAAEKILRQKGPGLYYPGQIRPEDMGKSGFKDWLKRDWKIPEKQLIIQYIAKCKDMVILERVNRKGKIEKKIAYRLDFED